MTGRNPAGNLVFKAAKMKVVCVHEAKWVYGDTYDGEWAVVLVMGDDEESEGMIRFVDCEILRELFEAAGYSVRIYDRVIEVVNEETRERCWVYHGEDLCAGYDRVVRQMDVRIEGWHHEKY